MQYFSVIRGVSITIDKTNKQNDDTYAIRIIFKVNNVTIKIFL